MGVLNKLIKIISYIHLTEISISVFKFLGADTYIIMNARHFKRNESMDN
jgi:hypothetical protein